MNPDYLVETVGLSFRFGSRGILHGLHLQVPPGSIYGFLGPNGAGKSTTLRLLLGLLRPASGSVRLFGHDLARHRVALLGQVGALIENPRSTTTSPATKTWKPPAACAGCRPPTPPPCSTWCA